MQISEIYNYALLVAALVGAGTQAKKSHESKEKGGVSTTFFLMNGLNGVHSLCYFGAKEITPAIIAIVMANLIFLFKNIIVCGVKLNISYLLSGVLITILGIVTVLLGQYLIGLDNFYGLSEVLAGLAILAEAGTVFRQQTAKGISLITMAIYTPIALTGILPALNPFNPLLLVARTMVLLSFLYILLFKIYKKE